MAPIQNVNSVALVGTTTSAAKKILNKNSSIFNKNKYSNFLNKIDNIDNIKNIEKRNKYI